MRDLAWLLYAPDLLSTPFYGRPTLAELGLEDQRYRRDWLGRLAQAPQAIEAMVGPSLAGRLGLYHEKLWHFLLVHAPNTRLLAHNLPVRDDRRTLGELDVLYATHDDPRPVHLELAIKYYLGLPQGPGAPDSQARWIGPSCADSLAIKRQRIIQHQLPLAARPEAAVALARFNAPPLRQRLAMPGILFYPWGPEQTRLPAPCGTAEEAVFGDWLSIASWPAFCQRLDKAHAVLGAFLNKPHWLAPPPYDELWHLQQLASGLEQHFTRRLTPRQLMLKHPDGPWQRIFVVGNSWPHAIPLPR